MGVVTMSRPYTVSTVITNPGLVSNLVIMASATRPVNVIRAQIGLAQATIPSPVNCRVQLVRKTTAPTMTAIAATTFLNHDPSDADSTVTAGHTATAEGADGDAINFGWGASTGWLWDWNPTPEEYIVIPAGTANGLAIKHVTAAPPAGVYSFSMTVHEIG